MKKILILDVDSCYFCPCSSAEVGWLGNITRSLCQVKGEENTVYMDAVSGVPNWCPMSHPLKYVSNEFYIYDTKYLMANLDREINLLKGTKAFEEIMEKQNESNTCD